MNSSEVSELIAEIKKINDSIERIDLKMSGMEVTMQQLARRLSNEKEDFPTQYSTTSKPAEEK